jgi:hypothetical protein
MTQSAARAAIIRTLSFHEAWNYLPTRAELLLTLDSAGDVDLTRDSFDTALSELLAEGTVRERMDRVGMTERFEESVGVRRAVPLLHGLRERDSLQPRKRRNAVGVARWLSRLSGVRFVALANTTALGNARDESDLDFFIIVKAGTIWTTRLLGGGPFKLLGRLPKGEDARDAVCLSYFIADDGLDLSSHALSGDDPYFRHWFLALLPLYDDGVSSELWEANTKLRERHPFARPWVAPPDLRVGRPTFRIPTLGPVERAARAFQFRWFPAEIRGRMNKDTTVIVNDSALKFHVNDGREEYRAQYEEICKRNGVTP